MEHYLMSKALDMGLGDFNRKDLIAATFMNHIDKGKRAESGLLCPSVSVCELRVKFSEETVVLRRWG